MANLVQACGLEVQDAGLMHFGYDRYCAQLARRLGLGFGGYRWLWRLAHLVRPEREIRILAVRPS